MGRRRIPPPGLPVGPADLGRTRTDAHRFYERLGFEPPTSGSNSSSDQRGRWSPCFAISDEQRRIRLGRRHLLAPSAAADSAVAVADAVVALHATDAATVFLSACARLTEPSVEAVEQALYEDVSLVRLLSMRHTLFAVSAELAPYVDASTARAIAVKERRTLAQAPARRTANGLDEQWLAEAEEAVLAALATRGSATGSQLSADVRPCGRRSPSSPARSTRRCRASPPVSSGCWPPTAASAGTGHAAPGPPASSAGRPREPWPALSAPRRGPSWPAAGCRSYGPATEADLKWWTGWTLGDVRKALAAVGAEEVRLDDGHRLCGRPATPRPNRPLEPWAALLPGLDPSAMGWADRGFHLAADHRAASSTARGNIGPTVWWNGRDRRRLGPAPGRGNRVAAADRCRP